MKKVLLSTVAVASILNANAIEAQTSEKSFFENIHAKGDLRLRHEIIEKEGSADKNRERYRFRYSIDFDLQDNLLLETAISSGRGNPTSGNVSFKDDENIQDYFKDELKIDIVDLKYSFDNSWIRAGKSKHHIYRPIKTQLVWDNDIRLEGINYGYKDENSLIRIGANRVHREEEPTGSKDINIFLAQYVKTQKLSNAKLNLGGGYYYYDDVKGNTTPYGKSKGNSLDSNNLYTEDYGILEAFGELKYKDVMGMPFKTALTLAYNTLADDDNFGYDISMQLGATKKVGDWQLNATYRDVQKDAVFGAHNDSDFSGGGTDSDGYFFKGKYKFAKNVDVAGWFNWSKLGDSKKDYHRTQLDVILKF
jgi:hypothetical protein